MILGSLEEGPGCAVRQAARINVGTEIDDQVWVAPQFPRDPSHIAAMQSLCPHLWAFHVHQVNAAANAKREVRCATLKQRLASATVGGL